MTGGDDDVTSGALRQIQIVLAVGYVVDDRDRCLLVRRHEPSSPQITNRWELPGGRVEFGENPRDTVQREVLEETGVVVTAGDMFPIPFVAIRRAGPVAINPIILCFRCRLTALSRGAHEYPAKIGEARWVPLTELESLDIQDGSKSFLCHMLRPGSAGDQHGT